MVKMAEIMSQSKLEETLNRIKTHKGVKGIVITDKEGFPIRSTMSSDETIEYAGLTSQLLEYMEREMAACDIRVHNLDRAYPYRSRFNL